MSTAAARRSSDPIGLVMVGFDGTEPTPAVEALIREGLGGIVLFARNLADAGQTAQLTRRLQDVAREAGHPPLLVAADQEGGRVRRLRRGLTAFPSAMALGATGDHAEVYHLCRAVAAELLSVGVNLNLAPCADVNSDPRNPVIGTRSYGGIPGDVAQMVAAAVRGYQDGGVLACAKHFPGHGHTDLDSHLTLPVINRGVDELRRMELVPFAAAIAAGTAAVMSAHIVLPPLTGDMPATLSPAALTGLLRVELGFRGLILTDCMEMAALGRNPAGDASVLAVAAGADLVLWSHTPRLQLEAIEALRGAAGTPALPRDIILAKLGHVVRVRTQLRDGSQRTATEVSPTITGGITEVGVSARRLALAAVTVLGGTGEESPCVHGRVRPALSRERRVVVLDNAGLSGSPEEPAPGQALAAELAACGYRIETIRDQPPARVGGPEQAQVILLTHNACLKPEQATALGAVLNGFPDAIAVVTGLPYDLALFGDSKSGMRLCTYDPGPASMWACAQVLMGLSPARGRLPVSLTGWH